jgi:hypothetical protein
MTYGGYDDWYLPGSAEARTLFLNRAALPVQSGTVWTSSEVLITTAREFNIGTGALTSQTKPTSRALLCVRKQIVPGLIHTADCGSASVNGQSCADGSVRFVGVDGSGKNVYTTAFQFPNSFWNNGQTTTSSMLATGRTSQTDGSGNTAAIAVADADSNTGTQIHNAASICNQLSVGGFADWYLPAISEAEFLYANRAGLPTIGAIWSSTEATATTAISLTSLGARSTLGKATELAVQCIRKQDATPAEPTVVLSDGFETFAGWTIRGSGLVTRDTSQARSGSASGLKSANGDPNGAYKMLDFPVGRNYELEAWIRSSDPRVGGTPDRIAIVNAQGNGYGPIITPTANRMEVRTDYNATILSGATFTRPSNAWYRVVFRAFPDNTFMSTIFDEAGVELSSQAFAADTTHMGPFDRLAILGGFEYNVDDVKVTNFDAVTPYWNSALNLFTTGTRNPLDIFGWAGPAADISSTVTRDETVTDSPYGGIPLKMVVTGTDPHIQTYNTTTGGPWNLASAATGQTWEVRVLAKGSVPTSIELFLFGTNAQGLWGNQSGTIGAGTRSITTSWQEYTFQYTFSNTVVQAVQLRLDGPHAGGNATIWFDGLQLYRVN